MATLVSVYELPSDVANVVRKLGTDALVITLPLVLFGVFRYLYLVHRHGLGGLRVTRLQEFR